MNYSEDSRIDEFCRELALALRRITGLTPESLPGDLAKQVEIHSPPRKDDGDDGDNNDDEDDEEEDDDEHTNQ